jgi:uncharacterized protein DUF5335
MSNSSILANQNAGEIHLDRWVPFLAQFTRENRGAHARLEIVGPDNDIGYQVQTDDRPFDGVSSDIKDREREVWIAFGSAPENHLSHGIPNAVAIRVLPPSERSGAVLEVESADGTRTILDLSHPESYALPPGDQGRTGRK